MHPTYVTSYLEDLRWTLEEMARSNLDALLRVLLDARDQGRQILLMGNGGSAATASHMACDLGKGTADLADPAFVRFRVLSLADNTALMTALGNDVSFDDIFVEQLKMLMRDGDVVIAISASGNSPNLVRAVEYARSRGAVTVGLLGFGGGRLGAMVDHACIVSSRNYGIAEDFHLILQHILTQHLRRHLKGPARPVAFLDRDGIINERPAPHEYVESWGQFRFLDGAPAMLRSLQDRGYALVVVSNQQGVGKGRLSLDALSRVHAGMVSVLAADGVTIDGIFCCPHLETEDCFCRKPKPGLVYRALNELPFMVDLDRSLLIGDAETDMAAAAAAGLATRVLVGDAGPESVATHRAATVQEIRAVLEQLVC